MSKTLLKQVKELTDHAIEKKIMEIKCGDISIRLHPAAFIVAVADTPDPTEGMTESEKLKYDKEQYDKLLFHSAD